MLRRLILTSFLLSACATTPSGPSPYGVTTYLDVSATTGTHVYLERGLGGYALGPGVDEIGQLAMKIPGVTRVVVAEYTQGQNIADLANADPPTVRVVVGGYSCGANGAPGTAAAIARSVDMLPVIQASLWCGNYPITRNVLKAQETYNPQCVQTAGLGCMLLTTGPGFNPSNFTVIDRPDCHPCADTDPDAQNDMVLAIKSVTSIAASHKMAIAFGRHVPGAINHVTRYHNQPAY